MSATAKRGSRGGSALGDLEESDRGVFNPDSHTARHHEIHSTTAVGHAYCTFVVVESVPQLIWRRQSFGKIVVRYQRTI